MDSVQRWLVSEAVRYAKHTNGLYLPGTEPVPRQPINVTVQAPQPKKSDLEIALKNLYDQSWAMGAKAVDISVKNPSI
jgi:hypothetical protein